MPLRSVQALVSLGLLLGGCRSPRGSPETTNASTAAIRASFDALPHDPLSLEAAREAHRSAELRRHLRFLETLEPGHFLRVTAAAVPQEEIDRGRIAPGALYEVGRLIFEHEYSFADGLGGAESRKRAAEHRSPFRRVHEGRFGGPETTTCTSCHWRGGPAGAGGMQDNSFLYGDGDTLESADPRNPPPLHGAGVVQALAREMSAELQEIRSRLVETARAEGREVEGELVSKGIRFGSLRVTADGTVDSSRVEGVDADLVIKPFGWKGTFETLRGFVTESLQVHFGIQSEDLVRRHQRHPDPDLVGSGSDPTDPDGDGVSGELSGGQLTALISYLAMQEVPVVRPPRTLHDAEPIAKNVAPPTASVFLDEWAAGRKLFGELGCAGCHTPMLVLKDPVFRTRSEVTGEVLEIDLSRQGERPRIRYDPRLEGYPVWLFSDMKRHDLGSTSEARHRDHGVLPRDYLTRRLWGLANSPPYFYDGHAAWFDDAITAHGGEAWASRSAYHALGREEKGELRVYLQSLTRERRLIVP